MLIREISFYKDFKCIEGMCPESCCHGWIIPLEDEDYKRIIKSNGATKAKFLLATRGGINMCFNPHSGTCPFLNKKGLCSMQLKHGHEFIPEVCRDFPRFFRNYGYFEERYIDLSCIRGAKMFLENHKELTIKTYDGEPQSEVCTTNDDADFFNTLLNVRLDIINALKAVTSLSELKNTLLKISEYSLCAQKAYLNGEYDFFDKHPLSEFTYNDAPGIFPFNIKAYEYLMNSTFYGERLKGANPRLYKLCMLYFKRYISLMRSNEKWKNAADEFLSRHPKVISQYAAYYSYYIYKYFLKIFEDYSFLRNVRLGIVHLNMIFMFDVLYERANKSLTEDEQARIIAVYDRRAYFNSNIIDDLYKVFEKGHL